MTTRHGLYITHNKPDFVVVKGWPRHLPTLQGPIPTSGTKSPVDPQITIKVIMVEDKYSDDIPTMEKREEAHNLYSGPD